MNWQFKDTYKTRGLRRQLVSTLQEKGIDDVRVLAAIEKLPRHYFIDNAFENFAYQDKPFSIGEGQTISQPYTVARQTEILDVQEGHKVLEVGTGSGYQSCVLLELGVELFSIEFKPKLAKNALFLIRKLGYETGTFKCGDGSLGWTDFEPFDRFQRNFKILHTQGALWNLS